MELPSLKWTDARPVHKSLVTPIAHEAYTCDANGNRTVQREANGAVTGNGEQTTTYTYDAADRLTDTQTPDRTTHYELDPTGNRTHETIRTATNTLIGDSTLTYNARSQLTTRDDSATGLHVDLTYDADGNTQTETDASGTRTFTYDARDRLMTLEQPNAPPLSFDYQSDGLRLKKTQASQETRYQYDQQSLLAETNSIGNGLARYHYSATQLISRTEAGSTPTQRHYLLDSLATPIALLTQQGTISARTKYDAWGEIVTQQDAAGAVTSNATDGTIADLTRTDQQPIGYTGYLTDSESGLYYAKARYYDPRIARFESEDPEEGKAFEPPSLHRYLYAYANPTVYADPSGRSGILTDARDNLDETDKILRAWAVESGDSGGILGNAGYVGASFGRVVVGFGSLPWRLLNLTSDGLAQTAPIAAIAPGVADTASSQFGKTVDTTAYVVRHPVNTGVAIRTGVVNTAHKVAAGDRGAGSDVINVAGGFLGPGLISKITEAGNAANAARQAGQNIERSLFGDLENGFARSEYERLPPPKLTPDPAAEAQAQQAKIVAEGPQRPVESPSGNGIAVEPVASPSGNATTPGRTYITYQFKNAHGEVVYVGRASGVGTPEQVMKGRLARGHDVFDANPGLTAEPYATQGNAPANMGAEGVLYEQRLREGTKLLNDPKSPPLSSKPSKAPEVRAKVEAYADDLKQ